MDELERQALERWQVGRAVEAIGGLFAQRRMFKGGGTGGGGTGGAGGAGGAGGGAAGGAGGAAGGADDDDDSADDDDDDDKPTVSKKALTAAQTAAKAAKQQAKALRGLLADLGVETEQVDDGKGGKKLSAKAADKLKRLIAAAADDDDDDDAAGGDDDDDDSRPAPKRGKGKADKAIKAAERKLAAVQTNAQKREQALTGLVQQLAVRDQLRAVLAAEGAIDTSDGDAGEEPFAELVEILERHIGVDLDDDDDDTGRVSIKRYVKGKDGQPRTDKNGNPMTLPAFVREWLGKRAHYRRADWSPGPGAGAGGAVTTGKGNRSSSGTAEQHAQGAGWMVFGLEDPTAAAKR